MGRVVSVFLLGLVLALPRPAASQENGPQAGEDSDRESAAKNAEATETKEPEGAVEAGLTEKVVVSASAARASGSAPALPTARVKNRATAAASAAGRAGVARL